jgi:uncharacterized repeat protein (TIGR03806 family)
MRSASNYFVGFCFCLGVACGGDSGGQEGDSAGPSGSSESSTASGASASESSGESETGEPSGSQGVDLEEGAPELLSEMNLLDWDGEVISYRENVYPYELNTPLFTDYALKDRAIFIPEGNSASYAEAGSLDFPVGTVIVKSFMFPADFSQPDQNIDLIETRVLVRFEDEWKGYPYIWDHELGDAVLTVQGEIRQIDFLDKDGVEQTANYLIPQKNQCVECHEVKNADDETLTIPIGPSARNLNREGPDGENQLTRLADAGVLGGLPAIADIDAAWDIRDLEETAVVDMPYEEINRASRDYLDVNCAYCHNPNGVNGISSQLFLNYDNEDMFHLGVCKAPGSAGEGAGGLTYDIVPGNADESILVFRSETLDVGAMMPLIGRSLAHDDGVELVRAWIDGMPPDDCGLGEPMP